MSRDLAHQHEWRPDPHVTWDEEVFVTFHCAFVEILGSATSERLDETFYDEGAKCMAEKTLVYEASIEGDFDDDEKSRIWEHLAEYEYDTVEDAHRDIDPYDAMDGHSIRVFDDPYSGDDGVTIRFELVDSYLDEGWD